MSAPNAFSCSLANFAGRARLFPLANLVLFPHVLQPLHVYEPRYVALLEESLATDRLLAAALPAPGWEDEYEGEPALRTTACLGRVMASHRLESGAYNVLVSGLSRVRVVRETPSKRPFRVAEVELCGDLYPADAATGRRLHRRLRELLAATLPGMVEAPGVSEPFAVDEAPLGLLTDLAGYLLDLELDLKRTLLVERNVHRRVRLLVDRLTAAVSPLDAPVFDFPPAFSAN